MMNLEIGRITPEKIRELFADEKIRFYSVAAIGAVSAMLYIFLAITPKCFFLSNASREIRDLQNNIELVENRIRSLDVLAEKLNDLSVELKGYSNGLPAKKDLPEFLEELSLIAKSSGIKILSITPAVVGFTGDMDAKEKVYYHAVPIVVTAESGYYQLESFINSLESSERFVTITDLKVQSNAKSPRRHNVKVSLRIYVSD
ncbi:MAG: type 4a pilus biogenesis protein PilO [Candidatus Omnitrophica bacterium]|nr:type 4a pilus biogenesis protein PilO [Candidatus Omnitrophota bacterium]